MKGGGKRRGTRQPYPRSWWLNRGRGGGYNPLHSKLKFTKSPDRNNVLTPKPGAHFAGSTSKGETTGHLIFSFVGVPVNCEFILCFFFFFPANFMGRFSNLAHFWELHETFCILALFCFLEFMKCFLF